MAAAKATSAAPELLQPFPNDPIFTQLLHLTRNIQGNIVHDAHGFDADYPRLLDDVLRLRQGLRECLDPSAFNEQGLLTEAHIYICVLVLGGYEFIVAFLAISALGGACVPLASGVLPEEAQYFLKKASSNCLLVGSDFIQQGYKIQAYTRENAGKELVTMPVITTGKRETKRSLLNIGIDLQTQISPTHPGVVLFTSGTTGRPKGVVLPRRRFYMNHIADPGDVSLCYRPPYWVGGLRGLIQPILTGQKLEILRNRVGTEEFWECLREGRITHFAVTPTILRQLKDDYQERLVYFPEKKLGEYVNGVKNLRSFTCSGAAIAPSTLRFWKELCTSLSLRNVYALTEAGGAITAAPPQSQIENSIGKPWPGVTVKLSNGTHGEILMKSPTMLTHYLGDEVATKAAIDDDGFLRTGDLAHLVGDEYVFDGRASTDWIFFYGYKIPILELENSLLDLPYISEAYVVAVPDHEAKEIAGAVVRVRKPTHHSENSSGCISKDQAINLSKVRKDLSPSLATHKLPALLRILKDGENVPQTVSDKAVKRKLLKQYFHITGHSSCPENLAPGVEFWGNQPEQVPSKTRPWDWCGLQLAR